MCPEGPKKIFFETAPPPYPRVWLTPFFWDCPPPPYLKVWICHCWWRGRVKLLASGLLEIDIKWTLYILYLLWYQCLSKHGQDILRCFNLVQMYHHHNFVWAGYITLFHFIFQDIVEVDSVGEDHPSKVVAIILTIKATMAGDTRTLIAKKGLKTRHKTVK